MRKIFERQIVDQETGEMIKIASEYVSKNNETFFMGRTTEGIEWLLKFNNLTEVQLLILMIELENIKNNYIISFHKMQVQESAKILSVSEITIRKSIANLVTNDFLVRVERGEFLANPLTFYKGGSIQLKSKLKEYNSVKLDKKDKLLINELTSTESID